ncbi:MBL fold metallo-hydrolase [Fodinicurvata halophila]|uniref:MBL fold metallo-hydrolase n=1 Tax=Fodinicurvata halophila TaxID=1419723 RepID=A0ABV8ULG1_9PROT
MAIEDTAIAEGLVRPLVRAFFDTRTSSLQYVVHDPATKKGVIIDPVLDFEERAGSTATVNADAILDYVRTKQIELEWILDTHPHADHFSAAGYLRERTDAPIAIGEKVVGVQEFWKRLYNLEDFSADGSQWDRLFADGETFRIGDLEARVMLCPGHTPASVTYVIGDAAFVHDTLFMPDGGTARADFPGGDAGQLWESIQKILSLPDETRLFTGHDYQPGGREPRWESTVAEQKRANLHVADKDAEGYVALREARDRTLTMPKLILQSLQVNIRGGCLPAAEDNDVRYLKIPLDRFRDMSWGQT